MGMPAARVLDMHVCPMVTVLVPHVGGPILPPCAVTVLTVGMFQARATDMCVCVGPPDMIAMGSATVLVMSLPAARMLDPTAHGGMITLGAPTVLIGDAGGGGGGAGGGAAGAPGGTGSGTPGGGTAAGVGFTAATAMGVYNELSSHFAYTDPPAQIVVLQKAAKAGTAFVERCHAKPPPASSGTGQSSSSNSSSSKPEPSNDSTAPGAGPAQRDKIAAVEQAVDPIIAERKKTAMDFFMKEMGLNEVKAAELLKGVDLSKPVEVVDIPPPDTMSQYVRKSWGQPGNWFNPDPSQTGDALGLNDDPAIRELKTFRTPVAKALKSSAAPIVDNWTDANKAVSTQGGGTQMTVSNATRDAFSAVQ